MTAITRPPGPGGHLGLRNAIDFRRNEIGFLEDKFHAYGDIVYMPLLGNHIYLISHPDDIEALLVTHHKETRKDRFTRDLRRGLGDGLVTSDGELWRRHRKLASFAFTPRRIHDYADDMVAITERGMASWRHGAVIDVHAEMSRITMDVAGQVLFGAEVDSDAAVVGQAMEAVNEFFAGSPEAYLRVPPWVPTRNNGRFRRAIRAIDGVLYRVIAERRAEGARGDGRDLLAALLSAQDSDDSGPHGQKGGRLDDRELRDECVTLFIAGHETTALALVHSLYLLAGHPAIAADLDAEVAAVLGGRRAGAADLDALALTTRIIKEAMRLYPPVWAIGREVTEELTFGAYRVPAGSQIVTSQWIVHRDPRWHDDPEAFVPDRWLPDRARNLPRMAYFPFGAGPRVCIGNHFAMMEAALLLATLVQRFRLELLPGTRLAFAPSITLRPRQHLTMRLHDRQAASAGGA